MIPQFDYDINTKYICDFNQILLNKVVQVIEYCINNISQNEKQSVIEYKNFTSIINELY